MSNFIIEIKAPELANALQALATALAGRQAGKPSCPAPEPRAAAPAPKPVPTPAAVPPQPAQFTPPQPAAPVAAPAAPPMPAAPPQPVVPTSAPQYTYDMLFNAAAALMGQNKGPQLQQLLMKYGIQRLPDLPPEQYGAYATDLRALGAKL